MHVELNGPNKKVREGGWNPEDIATLHRCVAEGWTGGQIAALIGRSRSAIIGRSNRDGLKLGTGRVHIRTSRHKLVRPTVKPVLENLTAVLTELVEEDSQMTKHQMTKHEPNLGTYTILDLAADSCRWPLGQQQDKAHFFCGAKTDCQPYCKKHAKLAFNQGYVRASSRAPSWHLMHRKQFVKG